MSQSKYNRLEIHPRTKKWEQTGVVLISKDNAEILNDSTEHSGIKYEAVKAEPKATKTK